MSNERVLVTGGAGFIGSTIVDRFIEAGHDVTIVDDFSRGSRANLDDALASGRCEVREIDVRSPVLGEVFEAAKPAIVAHLAAQLDVRVSVADPILDADINVLGTLNVFECARKSGARRVLIASSGGCIYGENASLPITEDDPGRPVSPYGISKKVLGDYADFYRSIHGLDSVLLALSNVFGPRQDPFGEGGVVSIFLSAMLEGRETTIFGTGEQTRDFVYVTDVADAFVRAATKGTGTYNIGTGVELTVNELWRACADATGYTRTPSYKPARPGELERNALDAARATRELGWEPAMKMPDGISQTSQFVKTAIARSR